MLEKLSESRDVWEVLRDTEKPIVMYGMGDGALKIMEVFKRYGIRLTAIFASDEYVRGHSFEGFPVCSFAQIQQTYPDFIIVLAFAAYRDPLLSKLYEMSEQWELYAPDVPVCVEDGQVFTLEYIKQHEQELDRVYDSLSDELSRKVFLSVLNFKVSGKAAYLREVTTPVEEGYTNLLCLGEHEHYVDLGAYNGDTVEEFLSYTGGKYSSITAFEPDKKNFQKLLARMDKLGVQKITALNAGSYSAPGEMLFDSRAGRNSTLNPNAGVLTPVDSVDHVLEGAPATLIKLDVEGAEEAALIGAEQTIRNFRPKLMVSAYHKNSDLFRLPLIIKELNPGYRVYLRHHPYIPAWETNFYFLP